MITLLIYSYRSHQSTLGCHGHIHSSDLDRIERFWQNVYSCQPSLDVLAATISITTTHVQYHHLARAILQHTLDQNCTKCACMTRTKLIMWWPEHSSPQTQSLTIRSIHQRCCVYANKHTLNNTPVTWLLMSLKCWQKEGPRHLIKKQSCVITHMNTAYIIRDMSI